MSRPLVQTYNASTGESIVREMNDEEFAVWQADQSNHDVEKAESVRRERDQKLAESDWRVIKALESNQPQDFQWASYRQALRDLPSQAGFPWSVVWPQSPVPNS
jgi:hypothetical protein